MKFLEKHLPEKRRLRVFKFAYGFLFLTLLCFLLVRQTFETEDFENRERIQGQRRILRPGARGDVWIETVNCSLATRLIFRQSFNWNTSSKKFGRKGFPLEKRLNP